MLGNCFQARAHSQNSAKLGQIFFFAHKKMVTSSKCWKPSAGPKQPRISSGGPRPAINCFHTYPPPYTFFHLPSSTLICFHHFSTFLSVHLIHFFIIIFPKFSPSFSPFSSPHSFHHIPLKISFPQSPRLIHFKKINFAKYIAKNICHQKNIRTV